CVALLPPYGSTVLQVGLSGLRRQSPTSCQYGQCWASAAEAGVSPTYAAAVVGRVTTRLRSRPWRDALRYSRPTVLRFCRLCRAGFVGKAPTSCAHTDNVGLPPLKPAA